MSPEILAELEHCTNVVFCADGKNIIGPIGYEGLKANPFDVIESEGEYFLNTLPWNKVTHKVMGEPVITSNGSSIGLTRFRILAVYDPPISMKEYLAQCSDT